VFYPLKITIGVIFLLFYLSGFSLAFVEELSIDKNNLSSEQKDSLQANEKKEISIRNVTHEVIHYSINRYDSDDIPVEYSLEIGEIHRFITDVDLDISFQSDSKTITYRLNPGIPFSFRYDEHDELDLYEGSHGRADAPDLAPYISTPMEVAEKMLELVQLDESDLLYDMGCGDGRIVILAAKKYGARGMGVDLDPDRIKESNTRAKMAGVEKQVVFLMQDVMKVDFSEATVVTMYLLPESNELLRPLLEKQLKPGAFVVSHNYSIPGWEHKEINFATLKIENGEVHDIYVYLR